MLKKIPEYTKPISHMSMNSLKDIDDSNCNHLAQISPRKINTEKKLHNNATSYKDYFQNEDIDNNEEYLADKTVTSSFFQNQDELIECSSPSNNNYINQFQHLRKIVPTKKGSDNIIKNANKYLLNYSNNDMNVDNMDITNLDEYYDSNGEINEEYIETDLDLKIPMLKETSIHKQKLSSLKVNKGLFSINKFFLKEYIDKKEAVSEFTVKDEPEPDKKIDTRRHTILGTKLNIDEIMKKKK